MYNTCMSDSPKMSIPKFKYKLQTCQIKSSKLSSLIDSFHSFHPFINQTCSMKLLVKSNRCVQNEFLRIFTNFKTVGHEFSIYGYNNTTSNSLTLDTHDNHTVFYMCMALHLFSVISLKRITCLFDRLSKTVSHLLRQPVK